MKYIPAKLNDANNCLESQWYVYFSFKHPETGKKKIFRKWISNRIKTKSRRRDKAKELINRINTKLVRGWNPFSDEDKSLTNIAEAIDFALKMKSNTVGKRTKSTYKSILGTFLSYLKKRKLDCLSIDEMNKEIAQDYCDYLIIEYNYTPRTYNNHVTALKTVFSILLKREYLLHNPFNNIDRLREPEPEITAYSKVELEKIANTLPDYNFELYVISQLIYYCFLRPAEIVRLQFKDLLWDHGMIIIPGTKSKNGKSQVIIIPEQLKKNLHDWKIDYPDGHFIFSRDLVPGTKEIAPTRIAEAWRKYANEFNINKNIYDFKHTGNGFAFDQGFNSRDIQLQNRHSSLDETQKYLNKFRRVASEKFREEFKGY
jgi:integrase/recombinase XerD